MLFNIRHVSHYRYSRPVFLEPHVFRFFPRADGAQWTRKFELTIEPEPAGRATILDAAGNVVVSAWFSGLQEELRAEAIMEVETCRTNAFDFLATPAAMTLPLQYAPEIAPMLEAARHRRDVPPGDPVAAWCAPLRREAGDDALRFVTRLTAAIYGDWEMLHRAEGDPWLPAQTLTARKGACRDLAVLMADACRSVGLAARFVSGYQRGDDEMDRRELHAWTEVYLPAGGWRGFDPMHGLAVTDDHVSVAASVDPGLCAPVAGTFRGTSVEPTLSTDIAISVDHNHPSPSRDADDVLAPKT